ncbi:MAG TPA: pirin family protein [Saprospiraceae bacterium]|jgi:redox-sensitive bicupin YhaK (pirin superfamily)|nr:pirin family protein [Saprospiraceae bacterium]HRP42881.1 pirin family protein [Saprospiraceae bacterium]
MPKLVIEARKATISADLNVRRILPFRRQRMVGPFIFLDHAGPVANMAGDVSSMDVLPHPHIGLSTLTYLLSGQVTHRDSLGVEQIIRPGEVNWMTAGKGIAHSERFEDAAFLKQHQLEMLQTWVALPEEDEESDPAFSNFSADELPVFTDKGLWMRLIAGEAYGLKSDVKTHSPLFYIHVNLEPGTAFELPGGYPERGIYITKGSIELNGTIYHESQMLVFGKVERPVFRAIEATTLILLGGEPLGDRYIWWNFVSSRKERIEQAKADWTAGRILLPPNDDKVFIPLPSDKSRPSEPPEANLLS